MQPGYLHYPGANPHVWAQFKAEHVPLGTRLLELAEKAKKDATMFKSKEYQAFFEYIKVEAIKHFSTYHFDKPGDPIKPLLLMRPSGATTYSEDTKSGTWMDLANEQISFLEETEMITVKKVRVHSLRCSCGRVEGCCEALEVTPSKRAIDERSSL